MESHITFVDLNTQHSTDSIFPKLIETYQKSFSRYRQDNSKVHMENKWLIRFKIMFKKRNKEVEFIYPISRLTM